MKIKILYSFWILMVCTIGVKEAKAGCVASLTASAVSASARAPEAPTIHLADLSAAEREAGMGDNPAERASYSFRYARTLMDPMHRHGELWPLKFHEPIFSQGLLNYYFVLFTGFNPNPEVVIEATDDYSETKAFVDVDRYITRNLASLRSKHPDMMLRGQEYPVLQWLESAVIALRRNPLLVKIGTVFQKQKIREERLTDLIEKGNEEAGRVLVIESAHLHKVQTVIARWMQQVSECLIAELKRKLRASEPIDGDTDPFIRQLSTDHPAFLNEDPYWASVIQLMKRYELGEDYGEDAFGNLSVPASADARTRSGIEAVNRGYQTHQRVSFEHVLTPAILAARAKEEALAEQLRDPAYVRTNLITLSKDPEAYRILAKQLDAKERFMDEKVDTPIIEKETSDVIHKAAIEKVRLIKLQRVLKKMEESGAGAAARARSPSRTYAAVGAAAGGAGARSASRTRASSRSRGVDSEGY